MGVAVEKEQEDVESTGEGGEGEAARGVCVCQVIRLEGVDQEVSGERLRKYGWCG